MSEGQPPIERRLTNIPAAHHISLSSPKTDEPKDNPSTSLTSDGNLNPQGRSNIKADPQLERTSTEIDQPTPTTPDDPKGSELSSPACVGLRLRSGTILPAPKPDRVSLDKYLNNLVCKTRESGAISIPQCDALDQRLAQVREQRIARIKKFKEETARFQEELLNFDRFSRSIDKKFEVALDLSSESVDENSVSEPSIGEIVLQSLSDSLFESSRDESFSLTPNYQEKSQKVFVMVDYTKVVKLAAQMVPLFSGSCNPQLSQELQTFIGCCKQVDQCLQGEEKTALLQILPTRLRGAAYQLVTTSTWTTLEELENLLNRAYLPRETYQELVNRLITCKQTPCESLMTFTQRVKLLLSQCKQAAETKYAAQYPAIKPQLEDFAMSAIKTGLRNPHLSAYLLTLQEDSVDGLIQKALDMERLQQGVSISESFNIPPQPYGQIPFTNPIQNYAHNPFSGNQQPSGLNPFLNNIPQTGNNPFLGTTPGTQAYPFQNIATSVPTPNGSNPFTEINSFSGTQSFSRNNPFSNTAAYIQNNPFLDYTDPSGSQYNVTNAHTNPSSGYYTQTSEVQYSPVNTLSITISYPSMSPFQELTTK